MLHIRSAVLTLSLASLLTACGGSDNSNNPINATSPNTGSGDNSLPRMADCIDSDLLKQEMLAQVNAARSQARNCGQYGDFPATSAISWNNALAQAADSHSQDMARVNFFSHTSSDGSGLADRVKAAGYTYSLVGENIAGGQNSTQSVVDGWIASPGHCKNLMTASFTEIGAACAFSDDTDHKRYWTLVMGNPR